MPELVRRWVFPIIGNRTLAMLTASQIVVALAGLFYGKLTALYISPDTWGTYALGYAALTGLHSFLINPTLQSFKTSLSQFPQNQSVYVHRNVLWKTYLALGVLVTLVSLYKPLPNSSLIWLALVGHGFYWFGCNYLNALGRHRQYVLWQMGYALASILVLIFIVVGLHQRSASGLWLVLAITNVTFAIGSTYTLLRYVPKTTENDVAILRTYQCYVWPLVVLAFWNWLLVYADRFLIRLYLTDADVGQYSMGYSLGSKILLLVAPILTFLSPQILQLRADKQPINQTNNLIYFYLIRYVVLGGIGCLFYYVARDWLGQVLLSERYVASFSIGPIVAISYLFLTSIHLLELKWYAYGQTRFILWHNVAGALLNIGFNLLLIPRLGLEGAAYATLLGFAGQFLIAFGLFQSAKFEAK